MSADAENKATPGDRERDTRAQAIKALLDELHRDVVARSIDHAVVWAGDAGEEEKHRSLDDMVHARTVYDNVLGALDGYVAYGLEMRGNIGGSVAYWSAAGKVDHRRAAAEALARVTAALEVSS